ncbi:MAG: hypothetical protein WCK89_09600 [bacterium]
MADAAPAASALAPPPEDGKSEIKDETKSLNPRVEADKMLRQAQQELGQNKLDDALKSANEAMKLDPNNIEAKSLVEEIQGRKSGKAVKSPQAKSNGPPGVDALLAQAKSKIDLGRVEEARISLKAALDIDPKNAEAKRLLSQVRQDTNIAPPPAKGGGTSPACASPGEVESSFQKGLVAYESGRLDVAVQWWNYTLMLDPSHPRAKEYLQLTRGEYDAWVQQHQHNAVQQQKEAAGSEKLGMPITYDSQGKKTIVDFLSAISLPTNISFYVADGVDPDTKITAKFEETPLNDALDTVLLPLGLKWSRSGDVISITADLRTKFFNLSSEQVARLKSLLENKTLQKLIYGPDGVPLTRGQELTLEDRENVLLVTDSQENISKVEAFLKDMNLASPQQLVYKSWKIRPEEGNKIKALVEAIVKVQSDAPYDLERKVVVDGEDLIVKDTADNVAKIENLLLDKNFIRKLETDKLKVQTYNLTPREPIDQNIEQVRELSQNIVTVVKTILYSKSTESAASADGRRYWYDPNTLQLTITDYPENLQVVSDYIRSLPTLGKKKQSEIIFLKHQTSGDLASLLNQVLGLTDTGAGGGAAGGMAGGNSITRTIRSATGSGGGSDINFRDINVRLVSVNQNDMTDTNDDSVELVVRTATSSEDRTITKFRSDYVEDYEIYVQDIRPSGTPGQGNARIQITYNPQLGGGGGGAGYGNQGGYGGQGAGAGTGYTQQGMPAPVAGPVAGLPPGYAQPGEFAQNVINTAEAGVQISSIENLNGLLIRYEDQGALAEVKDWITQLDVPVLQVNIETKLVEVNENRVKEFMPEFNIAGIGKGGIDLENSQLNSRFAQYADEFRDPFDPFPEDPFNAGLLKGTTVLTFLSGGETPVNFTLRMLESEGVVNIVNGPHILVENGQTATFQIEKNFGALPQIQYTQGTSGQATSTGYVQTLRQVDMSLQPRITQLGEIRLDIQNLELRDFGNDQGSVVGIDANANNTLEAFEPTGVAQALSIGPESRRRSLQTVARVSDGGTIVLGGWTGEHSRSNDAGVPMLRNIPYIGKLFFSRTSDRVDKTTLLIFLTCHLVKP